MATTTPVTPFGMLAIAVFVLGLGLFVGTLVLTMASTCVTGEPQDGSGLGMAQCWPTYEVAGRAILGGSVGAGLGGVLGAVWIHRRQTATPAPLPS